MKKSKNKNLLIGLGIFIFITVLLVALNVLRGSGLRMIGISDMEGILSDNDSGTFVYVGRPTCPACQQFEPILETTLADLGQELYYFETDRANSDDSDRTSAILNQLDVTGVPVIVYILNGQVIDSLVGVHDQDAIMEFFDAYGGL